MKPMCVLAVAVVLGTPRTWASQATWDGQLLEMEYLLLHISTINAINALGLSREQAVGLRRLARQVEAVGARVPAPRGAFRPDLAQVRDTYRQLKQLVLENRPVPEKMQRRVAQARLVESAVIRSSLRDAAPGTRGRGCARCHEPPSRTFTADDPTTLSPREKRPSTVLTRFSSAQKGVFRAHLIGLYGERGALTMIRLAPQVNKLLTGPQKEIVETFSCCLVPPQELSDPVRAGQAESSTNVLKLLSYVRTVPGARWPSVKQRVLTLMVKGHLIHRPGLTETQKAATRQRVSTLLEKARAMSDVDFELEKESLAGQLSFRAAQQNGSTWSAKAAMFLLLPGTDEVYTRVISRLDARHRDRRPGHRADGSQARRARKGFHGKE